MENKDKEDAAGVGPMRWSQKSWLLFFVDGDDEAAREVRRVLDSFSGPLEERRIRLFSTPAHSHLHRQFEVIYGHTDVNTVTIVASRGAAVCRCSGCDEIKALIERILTLSSEADTDTGEYGYPSEEFLKALMLGAQDTEPVVHEAHPSEEYLNALLQYGQDTEQVIQEACFVDSDESLETVPQPSGSAGQQSQAKPSSKTAPQPSGSTQPSSESEPQASGSTQPSSETEPQASGSSLTSSETESQASGSSLPRQETVLHIRGHDGASLTQSFDTSSLLLEVREVIAAHFSLVDGFGLATSYPRYHFIDEDYGRSLQELNLLPNAVLLIVPGERREVPRHTALWHYTGALTSWAYTLVMYMWHQIRRFLPFNRDPAPPPEEQNAERQQRPPGPTASRRRGNIHTLRDSERDDDDKKTTYNGNSTQQM